MPKREASDLGLNAENSGILQPGFYGLYPTINARLENIALHSEQKFIFLVMCFILLKNSSAIHLNYKNVLTQLSGLTRRIGVRFHLTY